MTTLELSQNIETNNSEGSFTRAARAMLHFVVEHVSFLPKDAPNLMSEHFGHAEKVNDLTPEVDNYIKQF